MTAALFLDAGYRRSLAAAAAFERDERARLYPQRIRDGKVTAEDAEADFVAWHEIARWCEGEAPDPQFMPGMELAAMRALQAGEAAVAKAPDDPKRIERREAVAAIHAALTRTRAWLADVNAALRERACGTAKEPA